MVYGLRSLSSLLCDSHLCSCLVGFSWAETRNQSARTQTPNDYQCAVLSRTGDTLAHAWQLKGGVGTFDFCINKNEGTYQLSYTFPSSTNDQILPGYESGKVHQNGRVCAVGCDPHALNQHH
jgi:hypothetical protein